MAQEIQEELLDFKGSGMSVLEVSHRSKWFDDVIHEAMERTKRLLGIGADFDVDDHGDTVLGREAGHSTSRIVHAGGDATGAEIMRALRSAVLRRPDITLLPRTRLIDLIRSGDRIVGLLTTDDTGDLTAHTAPAVVLEQEFPLNLEHRLPRPQSARAARSTRRAWCAGTCP